MAHSKCGSGHKKTTSKAQKKDATKANGASAVGARKQTKTNAAIATPMTKHKKKNAGSDPLFVDPPDDAYTPYFKEFEGKRAPNVTAVEDLLCARLMQQFQKILPLEQTKQLKPFGGKFLRASFCSLDMR